MPPVWQQWSWPPSRLSAFVWAAGHSFCSWELANQTLFHQSYLIGSTTAASVWILQFDYGDVKVTSRQQLEQLPFSSDAVLKPTISSLFRGWFWGWFSVLRQALSQKRLYSFFTIRFQLLKNWVRFSCLGRWISLQRPSSPGSDWVQGRTVEIQLDFQGIAQEEIDQFWEALTSNRVSISVLAYFWWRKPSRFIKIYRNCVELKDGSFKLGNP